MLCSAHQGGTSGRKEELEQMTRGDCFGEGIVLFHPPEGREEESLCLRASLLPLLDPTEAGLGPGKSR